MIVAARPALVEKLLRKWAEDTVLAAACEHFAHASPAACFATSETGSELDIISRMMTAAALAVLSAIVSLVSFLNTCTSSNGFNFSKIVE